MSEYCLYLLKVSVCIIAFYGFYVLMLRKCTFFFLNRIYLISGLLLSFILPVLNVSILKNQSDMVLYHIIYPILIEPDYEFIQPQNLLTHETTVNYLMILPVIYFTGISILFLKLLFSIKRIVRLRNNSTVYKIHNVKVVRTNSGLPFSFFNMVFLPENEKGQIVIRHEIAHIKQYHWADLILIEIAYILLWFNPFIFLYKKLLKLQHEYLADASAVKENRIEDYLNCMLKRIHILSYGEITSQFYCKTIKKRIAMITKNRTSNKYLGTYLLVLPLIFLLLFAFSDDKTLAQDLIIVKDDPANPAITVEFTPASDKSANSDSSTTIAQNGDNIPSIYPFDDRTNASSTQLAEIIVFDNENAKEPNYTIFFMFPEDKEIISTAAGIVIEAKRDPQKGNYVIIQHDEVFSTVYSKLKSLKVKAGDKLGKAQLIGYVGGTSTYYMNGLQYEILKNGKPVDSKDYLPK